MARRVFEGNFRHQNLQSLSQSFCFHIGTSRQIILTAVVLVLCPIFILVSRYPSYVASRTFKTDLEQKHSLSVLSGNLDYVQETQVVWQIPSSPRAILFIAHGCHCRATYYWDKSPNCAECIGLPEDRMLVFHALIKGYAVVAISSTRECWQLSVDKIKVRSILSSWIKERNLGKLPIVALGASSGGAFVSALASEYNFNSIVIMISEGSFKAMQIKGTYPPTLFVHMPKDKRRANSIKEAMDFLRRKGVPTDEVKCYQLAVTPQFFTKIPNLDARTSGKIYQVLKENGILDNEDFMKVDGRSLNWLLPSKGHHVMTEELAKKWELHLQELLNLAYGFHEMTSLQSDEIFEWFDTHLQKTAISI